MVPPCVAFAIFTTRASVLGVTVFVFKCFGILNIVAL